MNVLAQRGPIYEGRRRAFTLIETVIATIIVGVTLVAALNTLGATRTGEYKIAERGRALLLAQDLTAEILQQAYADPVAGIGSFGLDTAEAVPGDRSLFDDVDDYDGWSASPPQYRDGTVIPGTEGYERVVSVAWVNPDDLLGVSGSETGVKRIVVTVEHQSRTIVSLSAYRTKLWFDPVELQGDGD